MLILAILAGLGKLARPARLYLEIPLSPEINLYSSGLCVTDVIILLPTYSTKLHVETFNGSYWLVRLDFEARV